MANWLSIQAAAEKYGVTEGVIRVSPKPLWVC